MESKVFHLNVGENHRGRYLRISEHAAGYASLFESNFGCMQSSIANLHSTIVNVQSFLLALAMPVA